MKRRDRFVHTFGIAKYVYLADYERLEQKCDELRKDAEALVEALTKGYNSPRERCALMAEGEGPHAITYMNMADQALQEIDNALITFREKWPQWGEK